MRRILFLLNLCLLVACGTDKKSSANNIVDWKLDTLICDDPINSTLESKLLQSTVAFKGDTIIINNASKAQFVREKKATNDFFKDSEIIKEFYISIFQNRGIDISDSVSYIRLVNYDYNSKEFSFDSYSLWQTLICTDEYLCLPYKKFNAIFFKNPQFDGKEKTGVNNQNISAKNSDITAELNTPSEHYINLPFDFYQFQLSKNQDDTGKVDERVNKTFYDTYFDEKPILAKLYSKHWNEKPYRYWPFQIKGHDFNLLLIYYGTEETQDAVRYKLATLKNDGFIDGINCFSMTAEEDENWSVHSFTVSEDLTITMYDNTLGENSSILSQRITAKYTINKAGKFIKLE